MTLPGLLGSGAVPGSGASPRSFPLRQIEAALRAALPGVAAAAMPVAAVFPPDPVDGSLVRHAAACRQQEFAAGRAAARQALAALAPDRFAAAPVAIGRGRWGEPLFPSGIVGSIAHDGGIAAAVAGPADGRYEALGIDLHALRPAQLYRDIVEVAFTAAERDRLWRRNFSTAPIRFAAKEAVIKSLAATPTAEVDFTAITIALAGQRFRAQVPGIARPIHGLWTQLGRFVIAGASRP